MSLAENLKKETVKRLNLRDPVMASPDEPLHTAIERMRKSHVGCAIVVDEDRKPIGMFTEAMLTQLLATDPTVMGQPISRHLPSQWPWVKLTDPIADVLEALEMKNTRFLCVVNEQGRLCGLTGQKGLMEYIAEHFPGQVNVQRTGGRPFPAEREGA